MVASVIVVAVGIVAVAIIIGLGWVQNARNRASSRKSLARLEGYNAEELPETLATQAIPDHLARETSTVIDASELSRDVDDMRSAKDG